MNVISPNLFAFARATVMALTVPALACGGSGSSAALPEVPSQADAVSIELSRGPCEATCPEFSLVAAGDGTLTWEGHRHVAALGRRTALVSASDVQSLVAELETAGFSQWFVGARSKNVPPVSQPDGSILVSLPGNVEGSRAELTVKRNGVARRLSYVETPSPLVPIEAKLLTLATVPVWMGARTAF